MTASPALAQAEPILKERLAQAKKDGKVDSDVPFVIMSIPVVGKEGWRNYHCVDNRNCALGAEIILEAVSPVCLKGTICD